MKIRFLVILLCFNFTFSLLSQETAKPLTDIEIMRNVSKMDIEGEIYEDVTVTFKSKSPDYFISDKYRVKVTIIDSNRKIVWKKNIKNVFLYVFSDGQIQVAKSNFIKIIIWNKDFGVFTGMIREKEGIY